ncbi:NYN domain-containing protein [Nocardioides sp. zg-536]|uniref:NYN domain-containing protein n=1 Tax=Nocardioides faecalis TaxID=2803858 RepID=A0A939BSB8_9ACTN|nr:NYN domain-containing protein [Nocardioides faecalis]MBM9459474.1 NYN domain-containing protein [Nocardioides faecalis]QVI59424.1 NYN domain-containing protein [Nocardioides faecalis]
MTDYRIAVLIDADNVSHTYASAILAELAKFGRTTVKRAYGDWTADALKGWKTRLNRHAITPEQTFAYTTGKNSTDSALIIDAMDLLYSGNVDAFAIVSSDSDFTRLATRLRESGKTVYAVGRSRTPIALQEACDRFIRLELLDDAPDEHAANTDAAGTEQEADAAPVLPNLQSLLTRGINNASDEEGWVSVSALGNYLRTANPSFDPRLYGHPKLLALVEAQPYLVTSGTGSSAMLGLKGKVPAKRTTARKTAAKKTAAEKAEPKTSEPRKAVARKTAAKKAEPTTSEPKVNEPEKVAPEKVEAEKVEPKRATKRTTARKKAATKPAAQSTQPAPQARVEQPGTSAPEPAAPAEPAAPPRPVVTTTVRKRTTRKSAAPPAES